MPRIEKITDTANRTAPLQITRRKERRITAHRTVDPCITIGCGCCDENVEIFYSADSLEINGVNGTVDQWQKVLLPLLGMEYPRL